MEYTTRLERKLGLTGMELGSGWVDLLKGEGSDNHESKDKANEWTPDGQFVMRLLHLMSDSGTDFTNTWQALADVPASSAGLPKSTRSLLDASMTMRESDTTGLRPPACTNGHSTGASTSGSNDAIGSQGGDLTGTHRPFMSDEEILRPLLALLVTAKASSTQRQEWAVWTREYMARIDSQVCSLDASYDVLLSNTTQRRLSVAELGAILAGHRSAYESTGCLPFSKCMPDTSSQRCVTCFEAPNTRSRLCFLVSTYSDALFPDVLATT